jgi:cytochrome bd-type quinol oxidase subunit 1
MHSLAETIAGVVLMVLGILAAWKARSIAPGLQQMRIEQVQRSSFSGTYRDRLTALYRSPKQLILTMWQTRIFSGCVALIGLVLLIAGLAG